jgi:transcriptional regulator with XRE-family HTH domain
VTDDLSTRLAANLKRLRDGRGLSQQALADLSGVPRPTVAHLESGQSNPTLAVVSKLARSLGVTLDGLIEPARSEVRVLEAGELRVERRGKAKRTHLVPEGAGMVAERIELRPGGSCSLEAARGSMSLLACERGELVLSEGEQRAVLKPERAALVWGTVQCSSPGGGIGYCIGGLPSL